MRLVIGLCFFTLLFNACGTNKSILDKPIVFNDLRNQLTLNYLKEHYHLEQPTPTITPKMIVIHWTEIPTLEASFKAFKSPTLPNTRTDITSGGNLNVSAHFLVDRDGTIYKLMPETTMARHVIGLNHTAIGIENVGGTAETPLTNQQLKANIWLIKQLSNKFNLEYVIGHHEYTLFENHGLWLEKDANYRTVKTDPGPVFMNKIRKKLKPLNLKPIPTKIN